MAASHGKVYQRQGSGQQSSPGAISFAALSILGIFWGAIPACAAAAEWSLLLEPMYMDAYGHDPHVLTIHEFDLDSTPTLATSTPVTLDTEAGPGFRLELQYNTADEWGLGLDFFWFSASQGRESRTAAAGDSSASDQIIFEIADRSVTSSGPGEVLQFSVLEDTDVATWTADLYGLKSLGETPQSSLDLQFGVRSADFDNDFHSAVALEGVSGSLIDASSNYSRMTGPLVGLSGEVRFGKHAVRGYIGQSVVFGTVELNNTIRDFVGPLSAAPTVVSQQSFGKDQDVAIPITEFRINWLYPVSRHLSLGLSANSSVWWDVPVPPGVIPIPGGDQVFHENTIVYFGLAVAVKLKY